MNKKGLITELEEGLRKAIERGSTMTKAEAAHLRKKMQSGFETERVVGPREKKRLKRGTLQQK